MTEDDPSSAEGREPDYIDGVDGEDLGATTESLSPTPAQHERLKEHLHGEQLRRIKRADRRYLVIGRGGDGPAAERRKRVRRILDGRRSAVAFRLEDFGLSGAELELWAPAFDVLSETATRIVGILEDYDGGHVWELGFLYQRRHREALWLLKRRYETDAKRRAKYDNGMAASHLAALEAAAGDRVLRWTEAADLPEAVEKIP